MLAKIADNNLNKPSFTSSSTNTKESVSEDFFFDFPRFEDGGGFGGGGNLLPNSESESEVSEMAAEDLLRLVPLDSGSDPGSDSGSDPGSFFTWDPGVGSDSL